MREKRLASSSEFGVRSSEQAAWSFRIPHSACRTWRAFTLVEMILVGIIIGMLAAMVVPRLVGRTEQAKVARAKADIAAIGLALDLYEVDMEQYPNDSLEPLVMKPSDGADRWKGPYLKRGLPKDPWGHQYEYKKGGEGGQDYSIASYGSDGKPGNDDISNVE